MSNLDAYRLAFKKERKAIAKRMLTILRMQPSDDVKQLRDLANEAAADGHGDLADEARFFADVFETNDIQSLDQAKKLTARFLTVKEEAEDE